MDPKRHLLAYILEIPLSETYLSPSLTESQQNRYDELCHRLEAGEPLAYLTGWTEFWSLPLKITSDVLIPRPGTESLVSEILASCPNDSLSVLELGTGSGAISIALQTERPKWKIFALDNDPKALSLARKNAQRLDCPIFFFESNWFETVPVELKFDLIVSNPPYLSPEDPHLSGEIRYEPQSALIAQDHGLADLKRLIEAAPIYLAKNGLLFLEHGYDQGQTVKALFEKFGYAEVKTFQDLQGHDRFTMGRYSPPW